jgi:nitrate reductase gamma subunit
MQPLLDFARGDLFAVTFGIMVLGLLRILAIQVGTITAAKGRRLRHAPWGKIAFETMSWAVPFRHFIKGTIIFSSASFAMHIGLLVVPLFLLDHVVLWEGLFGVRLPAVGYGLADTLTLTTLACLLVLLAYRLFSARHRAVSRPVDYGLIVAIILPFATGYLAAHPAVNPFRWEAVMLVHVLSAEALFLMVPFTKLAHVVLFFFDRISEIHWQLRPGAGQKVASALFGSEAKV